MKGEEEIEEGDRFDQSVFIGTTKNLCKKKKIQRKFGHWYNWSKYMKFLIPVFDFS